MINEKNLIDDNMMFFVKSEIRLKILTELSIKPQSIKEIVDKTHMAYSSVSNNLNKMEHKHHVTKENRIYELTPMTQLYFNQLMEFKKSIDVVKNFDSLWDKHNLKYLNIDSINNITELHESQLIETNPIDIYKTHNSIKRQLESCSTIKGILPYIHPDYPKLIEKVLENGGSVELIIQKDVYRTMSSQIDTKLRQNSIKKGNLKIHILNKNIDIYLLICDKEMNLGLFKNDGSYDQNRILNSNTEESYNWADKLFKTIKRSVI